VAGYWTDLTKHRGCVVKQFDVAQVFISHCEQAGRICELSSKFERSLQQLGFRYFACGSHVDPLNPHNEVMLLNYPCGWVKSYSEHQLHRIDPVFMRAGRTLLPFAWDDPQFQSRVSARQREVLLEARRFGIEHGYTIPIHSPQSPLRVHASCSVIPDSTQLGAYSYFAVQLMAGYLFEATARLQGTERRLGAPELSQRERQCLELAAQGKSDWDIARLLGISECTVHNHVEHAKRRLNVVTRVQAIVHALATGQIAFGDIVRQHYGRPHPQPEGCGRRRFSRLNTLTTKLI
jgi:DNA-binding CsgD family transcriptional regulator